MTVVWRVDTPEGVDDILRRLEELRKELGLTERAFSLGAGLNENQYQRTKNGAGLRATAGTLAAYSAYAKVSLHWLVTGEGPKYLAPQGSETVVELDPRYPNLSIAVKALGHLFPPEAVQRMTSAENSMHSDRPISWWVSQLEGEAERVASERDPVKAKEQAALNQRETARVSKETAAARAARKRELEQK